MPLEIYPRSSAVRGVVIRKLEQTLSACPTQWDAWAEDGTYYYIRYRFGRLTIDKGEVGNTIFNWVRDQHLFQWDGMMDQELMLRATGFELELDPELPPEEE